MNISALKNLNLDRVIDMEEAISLSADARLMSTEYSALGIPEPAWLDKSTNVLREEIGRRTHASDMAALKQIENELEGYKSVGEKRDEARRRLVHLQKKLGLSAKA